MIRKLKSLWGYFRRRILYGLVLYWYGQLRHRALLNSADRSQHHTYTCFCRSPGQLEALVDQVMKFLADGKPLGKLQINVFAGSEGAEAYTVASTLMQKFSKLDFQITASDLHQEMVDRATRAIYPAEDVHRGSTTQQFIATTFDKVGNDYQVKPEIRARVHFSQASLLDPQLINKYPKADIVYAQNVLCHLNQSMARDAFANIIKFLKPRSVLFIDGMELNMREELTNAAGLEPLDYRVVAIHELARMHISDKWWTSYYGMEPYFGVRKSKVRRFSTIFFKRPN